MPDLVNQGSAFILKKLILYFFDGDREVLQTYPAIWPFLNRGNKMNFAIQIEDKVINKKEVQDGFY